MMLLAETQVKIKNQFCINSKLYVNNNHLTLDISKAYTHSEVWPVWITACNTNIAQVVSTRWDGMLKGVAFLNDVDVRQVWVHHKCEWITNHLRSHLMSHTAFWLLMLSSKPQKTLVDNNHFVSSHQTRQLNLVLSLCLGKLVGN